MAVAAELRVGHDDDLVGCGGQSGDGVGNGEAGHVGAIRDAGSMTSRARRGAAAGLAWLRRLQRGPVDDRTDGYGGGRTELWG